MNKYFLYSLFFVTSALSSCSGDYDNWATPQGFEQEDAQNISFAVTAVPTIDMKTITDGDITIFTPIVNMPEGSEVLSYSLISNGVEYPVTAQGCITAENLKALVDASFNKRPVERSIPTIVNARIRSGESTFKSSTNLDLKVIPDGPVIEDNYYAVSQNGNFKVQFIHAEGIDVYDDPTFKAMISAVDEKGVPFNLSFYVVPESAIESGDKNFYLGAGAEEGTLFVGGKAFEQAYTPGSKYYSITLNMLNRTISITQLAFNEYIYIPGNHQGWDPATAPTLHSPNSDGYYTGYCYLNTEFKFTQGPNWDSGEYNYSAFINYSANFSDEGSGNIKNGTPGYYYLIADVANQSLTATAVQWGLIGDATEYGWDASTPMTLNADNGTWSVTTTLKDGTFKFRANDGWDLNMGGSTDALKQDGDNINVSAGTYKITLNLNDASHYYCTLEKQ